MFRTSVYHSLSSSALPVGADPEHTVVGLPSLSPTMTAGTIAEWHVKEGDEVLAGDVFCSIETDKAMVDFECQNDCEQLCVPPLARQNDGHALMFPAVASGFVAKIFVNEAEEVPTATVSVLFVFRRNKRCGLLRNVAVLTAWLSVRYAAGHGDCRGIRGHCGIFGSIVNLCFSSRYCEWPYCPQRCVD